MILSILAGAGMVGYRLGQDSARDSVPAEIANIPLLLDLIEQDAVDAVPQEELVDAAIEGVLEQLDDQYAVFYDPERYLAINADLDGEFVGIGVTIEEQSDGVYITGVLPSSPAEDAGIEAGERIVSVDGTSTLDGATSGDVIELIAGEEGTQRVLVLDSGEAGERELTLTLRELDLPQVFAEVRDSGYGYVAAAGFSRMVAEQMEEEVQGMLDADVPGIVLDLRGNPGGLLNEAVEVVSLFAEEGEVVSVESRGGFDERDVDGNAIAPNVPLVVLVDGNSASASEIVAGALQDLDRAEIVGETTFGKGTVQTIQDLAGGAGVKFTTARYFTPSGDSIEGVGVEPDIQAEGDRDPESETDPVLDVAEDVLADLVAGDN